MRQALPQMAVCPTSRPKFEPGKGSPLTTEERACRRNRSPGGGDQILQNKC